MRNKIQLYIGGERADLDNGSFLLLNYTMEELSNPTIVRNSFSKQITLKGTPQNNKIFGDIYRNDRLTQYGGGYTGVDFDPTRKTPFTIYNEMGEILESGYLKLDKVTTTKKRTEYSVTLYGGLGSFLYGLSYKANGEKMAIADLDFGETLDFTIDRDAVADAWARLGGDTSKPAKWDIVNFIPGYTGLPSSPFDANKAIAKAASVGLPAKDGDYSARDGWCLATLSDKVTGDEAKDIRSYLQKPALKMSSLINAICDPSNNGGYTVNLDGEFFTASNPYWNDTWLTLPMLGDLNIDDQSVSGSKEITGTIINVPDGGNLSKLYSLNVRLSFETVLQNGLTPYTEFQMHCEDDWAAGMQGDDSPGFYLNYFEIQLDVKDGNDAIIKTIVYRISTMQAPEYMEQMDEVFDYLDTTMLYKDGTGFFPTFNIEEYGVAKIELTVTPKAMCWGHLRASSDPMQVFPLGSYDYTEAEAVTNFHLGYDDSFLYYTVSSSSTVRTGAAITQSSLLGGSKTPADYLLSYCKQFGLQLVCHKDSKTVDILLRKNLYNGSLVDISGRIDHGKQIVKNPFAFTARWYLFGNDAKGDYAEFYANKYGRPYGQFRVNTGYEFDATDKRLTEGIVFGNACEVMETSKYFCDLSIVNAPVPAVFLGGGKFTLYKSGDTKEFDISLPTAIIRQWANPSHPMHDAFPKMQFHGSDNAHLDERDTLVFFNGMESVSSRHLILSDDTRMMLTLNGNNPCWMLGFLDWEVSQIPRFGRYIFSGSAVQKSLDFGDPLEAQIPGITFATGSNIFSQYWAKYIGDRYDDDSAVLLCYADLRGLQVNENLFRQFYAFGGAVWALNRIIDHSLTTSGCTKCEFVKVQDTTNYTTL